MRRAWRLVRRHWSAVKKLAAALVEHDTLTGDQIDELIGDTLASTEIDEIIARVNRRSACRPK
jgi:hypothetical protein